MAASSRKRVSGRRDGKRRASLTRLSRLLTSSRVLRPLRPAVLLVSLLLAGGCDRSGSRHAWHHLDLTQVAPRVEISPLAATQAPFRRAIGFLGAEEMRNLAQVPPATLATYPHQSAGQVRVLEQAVGSRLGWKLTPGEEAYFSFTPLLEEGATLPCTFRVGVRDGEALTELHRVSPEPSPPGRPPFAPAQERVDLSRWTGREIELLVQVDPPAGAPVGERWVRWASPGVYGRARAEGAHGTRERPNVLLIGIDTLRADHVGAFRTGREPAWAGPSLTPAIDRLAAESEVWLDAYSTFNVTNPSFASILTGLYGKNHGVYDLKTPLPKAHTTMAELFQSAGYDTLAVIAARHLGDHNSGLGQGFETVVRADEHYSAELGVETAMDWVAERRRPFFAWVHLFDPHTPHTPPRPYALGLRPSAAAGLGPVREWLPFRSPSTEVFDQPVLAGNRHLYAGEVAYLDHQVDRLLDFLASRGLAENTVVALVADHGENLGEHGFLYRHIGLWETTTHVPMLLRRPGAGQAEGRRVEGLVQTIDLFPTVLGAAGIEVPPQDGVDLAGPGQGRRAVFAEDANRFGITLRTADWRYVRSAGNPAIPDGAHLYDLKTDPGETNDLAGKDLAIEAELSAALDRWLAKRRPTPGTITRELTPEEVQRLKALGYL